MPVAIEYKGHCYHRLAKQKLLANWQALKTILLFHRLGLQSGLYKIYSRLTSRVLQLPEVAVSSAVAFSMIEANKLLRLRHTERSEASH